MGKKISIAIAGSRGIPNKYGGFEQCAQYLAVGLAARGHDVTVYNSSEHPYKEDSFEGVNIEQAFCPEVKLGAAAHFIYDWLCHQRSIRKGHDVVLALGYQSSAPAIFFHSRKGQKIITNMDGLEWQRSKWGFITKLITRLSEWVAVKYSHSIISDNIGIENYFLDNYNVGSYMIPYGAEVVKVGDFSSQFSNLEPFKFHLILLAWSPKIVLK